jgi:hypothetical protein
MGGMVKLTAKNLPQKRCGKAIHNKNTPSMIDISCSQHFTFPAGRALCVPEDRDVA